MNINLKNLLNNSSNDDLMFNDRHRAIKNYRLMQWAKIATFGLYLIAVFMLYVADVWGISSFITKNSNEYVALIVFSIISFALAFFLASSKEATYEDIAIHRSEGWRLTPAQYGAMALYLCSGILFEMFSTSNNQQHIANNVADGSSMMKSIQGTDINVSRGSALTESLQKAQVRLASCEKKLSQGKVKDCVESQANLDAVKDSMSMANQVAQDSAKQSIDNKVDAMLKVRESFDKPMFQAIGKATGTDNNTGMMLVIAVLIFVFECQHIYALFAYSNSLRRLKQAGNAKQDNAVKQPVVNNGYGEMFKPSPTSASLQTPFQAMKQEFNNMVNSSPEIIANEYARAQHARQNFYSKAADKFDSIQSDLNKAKAENQQESSNVGNLTRERFFKLIYMEVRARVLNGDLLPTVRPVTDAVTDVIRHHTKALGLQPSLVGQPERQQIAEKILEKLHEEGITELNPNQAVGAPKYLLAERWANRLNKTFRQELNEGEKVYSDSPLDKPRPAPLNQDSDKTERMPLPAMLKQIHADVLASGANTPDEVLRAVKSAYLNIPNPTPMNKTMLQTIAGNISKQMDSAPTSDLPTDHPTPTIPETIPPTTKRDSGIVEQRDSGDMLYQRWKGAVSAGELSTACGRFYKFARDNGSFTGIANRVLDTMWNDFGERGVKEGWLLHNPDFVQGSTKPKYILA